MRTGSVRPSLPRSPPSSALVPPSVPPYTCDLPLTLSRILSPAETVIDFDRILVLRAGRVVECDSPLALLDKPEGVFREMVEATGNFDALRRAAGGRDAGSGGSGGREQ